MKKIEVDNEVYEYLESKVSKFRETPNQTLRRLLKLDISKRSAHTAPQRRKKRKTNLSELINAGLLKENQILFLHDYQGNRIVSHEVRLRQGSLVWNNRVYSMSDLAKNLLKKQGFHSESVRGPAHWYTTDGRSVKDIWESFLEKQRQGSQTQ